MVFNFDFNARNKTAFNATLYTSGTSPMLLLNIVDVTDDKEEDTEVAASPQAGSNVKFNSVAEEDDVVDVVVLLFP